MPKNKKIGLFLIIFIFLITISLFFLNLFYNNKQNNESCNYEKFPISVHFIDVGQGDCELISFNGKNILVDSGEKEKGSKVTRYIKKLGIKKLDYIIATHPHTDHIGGFIDVIKNFEVSTIFAPYIPKSKLPTNDIYYEFLKNVLDRNIKTLNPKAGDFLNFGESVINFVGPKSEKNYTNINDYSIGFLFKHKNISFLLCGDMEYKAERDLLESGQNIKADVLKLNHHGSKTSNMFNFLKAVSPTYCVAEVGDKNPYEHPDYRILKRLKILGIKNLYRTDINGNIVFYTDGETIKISKQKE